MKRMLWATAAWLVVGMASFLLAEHLGWWSEADMVDGVRRAGLPGALMGAGLLAGDVILPVPSSVVMTLHGMAFGTFAGTALSFAGSMAAAVIGFLIGRGVGGSATVGGTPETESLARRLTERLGPSALILSRPVPLLAEVVTCLAGMGGVSWPRFLGASAAGTLPLSLVYAAWGARGGSEHLLLPTLVIAVVLPVAGWVLVERVWRPGPRL